MEEQFQLLFDKMKIELTKQTAALTESISTTIMERMEEKLEPIITENKILKTKIEKLEEKFEYCKRERKNNNIVIFGVMETEKSNSQIINTVKKAFKDDLKISLEDYEINNVYRLGKMSREDKPRPVLLSFVCAWKKYEIMKNKKNLKDLFVKDDFSKEVMEKRKELLAKLDEEKKKGNIAYLRYDKLIVKERTVNEKRKRDTSASPQNNIQSKKQFARTLNDNRANAFDIMRNRSNSFSNSPTTSKKQ